jgi:multicomponent Na+:H+ antiporter subunit C
MIPDLVLVRYPFLFIALLLVVGVYGMIMKRNLLKKVIGMNIFQAAIFLLFVQGAQKTGASIPVLSPELGSASESYMNPLPHVMVLTAIVVGVAITGVAISLLLVTYRRFGTLDEARILEQLKEPA